LPKCPVIIRQAHLGWLELACGICGGNSQPRHGPFLKGILGMTCHLVHKHSTITTIDRRFDAQFVLQTCVRRRLSIKEVDDISTALAVGSRPIPHRPCSSDDIRDSGQPMDEHSQAGSSALVPTLESAEDTAADRNSAQEQGPSTMGEHPAHGGTALGVESVLTATSVGNRHDFRQTKIVFEKNCPLICHQPTEGTFELCCSFCKGNASQCLETNSMDFLSGPQGFYSHIRQAHGAELKELGRYNMSLETFEQNFIVPNCINRRLSFEEVEQVKTAGLSGWLQPAKKAVVSSLTTNDAMFPTLHPENFPTVVLTRDLKWVELRCPECGTNRVSNRDQKIRGVKGFQQHLTLAHGLRPPNPSTKWEWAIEKCTEWTTDPEVDIKQIETRQYVIPTVGPAEKHEEQGVTTTASDNFGSIDGPRWEGHHVREQPRYIENFFHLLLTDSTLTLIPFSALGRHSRQSESDSANDQLDQHPNKRSRLGLQAEFQSLADSLRYASNC
jgi:hypothetical protein